MVGEEFSVHRGAAPEPLGFAVIAPTNDDLMVWHVSVSRFHGPVEAANTNAVQFARGNSESLENLVTGRFAFWTDEDLELTQACGLPVDMESFKKEIETERSHLDKCLASQNEERRKTKRSQFKPLSFPVLPETQPIASPSSALELANYVRALLGAWLSTERVRVGRAAALGETEPLRPYPPQWVGSHHVVQRSR